MCFVLFLFAVFVFVGFVLSCFALFCLVCFRFVLFCFDLFVFVSFCFVLVRFVLLCFVLFCFLGLCFVLFCFVLFCFVCFRFVLFVLLCFVLFFVCLHFLGQNAGQPLLYRLFGFLLTFALHTTVPPTFVPAFIQLVILIHSFRLIPSFTALIPSFTALIPSFTALIHSVSPSFQVRLFRRSLLHSHPIQFICIPPLTPSLPHHLISLPSPQSLSTLHPLRSLHSFHSRHSLTCTSCEQSMHFYLLQQTILTPNSFDTRRHVHQTPATTKSSCKRRRSHFCTKQL